MQKNFVKIILGVVLIFVIGSVALAFAGFNFIKGIFQQEVPQNIQQGVELVETGKNLVEQNPLNLNENAVGSLMSIFNKGGNLKCTFNGATPQESAGEGTEQSSEAPQNISGTIYIADKKMRGEFDMTVAEGNIKSYMISDGEFVYSWSDMLPVGFKMKMNDVQNTQDPKNDNSKLSPEMLNALKTFNQDYNYNCTDWKVDETFFKVPADVNFTDFSNFADPNALIDSAKNTVKEKVEGAVGSNVDLCKSCELIPAGEAKNQCLQSLNCN